MLRKALQPALSDGMLLEREQRLACLLLQSETDDFCLSSASKSHHHKPYVCANAASRSLAVSRHFACHPLYLCTRRFVSSGAPTRTPRGRASPGPSVEAGREEDLGLRFPRSWGATRGAGSPALGGGLRLRPAASSSPHLFLLRRPEQQGGSRAAAACGPGQAGPGGPALAPLTCARRRRRAAAAAPPSLPSPLHGGSLSGRGSPRPGRCGPGPPPPPRGGN